MYQPATMQDHHYQENTAESGRGPESNLRRRVQAVAAHAVFKEKYEHHRQCGYKNADEFAVIDQ